MVVSKPFHVLSPEQFNRSFLEELFVLADKIRLIDKSKEGNRFLADILSHKRSMLYFTQPSSRTFLSFQTACSILGIKASEVRDTSISSEKKGESVEDSLRTFSSYVDLIIMRSPLPGLCDRIASLLNETPRPIPVINAGSGPDEHPTQSLLDLYTLSRNFAKRGGIDGKKICMVGDLRRGRTVRSLSKLLTNYQNVEIIFCSPKEFKILDDIREFLRAHPQISFSETGHFVEAISQADAVYMTRIQDEYDQSFESKIIDISKYCLTYDHLNYLKDDAVILHPMPRREELDPRVDLDPRAEYWRQERNGMWTRAALICKIFGVHEQITAY
ncbi:MAG: aspartate carbamoyltransferase [Oligoflexales bacterium]|nr:aspartate carbamoyltransferase [Oligoflexales bacterium]